MTPSEPGQSQAWAAPLPPPPAPPLTGPGVPLDQPARTSPLTVGLELLGLAGLGAALGLALLAGATEEVVQSGVAVLVIFGRVLGWWFRTYTVTRGELVLDEGILQKHHRAVPFSRIQQVELRQQLMARALGIATVHIETAADAGGTAVTLRALNLAAAEALRDHLLDQQRRLRNGQPARTSGGTAALPVAPRTPLARLDPAQLLVAGATSTGVVAAGVLVVAASAVGAAVAADSFGGGALSALLLLVVFTVGGIGTLAALAAIGTLVSAWGFELTASGDDLHLEQGLFDRRQHTMPRHRLQHARVVDNPLRRLLGTASVQLHSAATPGRGDEQQSFIDIPLVRAAAVPDLLAAAMGSDDFRPPTLDPRPPAARRRAILRRTAVTVLLAATIAAAWWPAGAGVLPLALLGVPWGLVAHRRAGSALDGAVLAVASGAVVHHLELVPRARVQSARTSTSPLQRRVRLASLHLDVAGSRGALGATSPSLGDLAADVASAAMQRVTAVAP